MQDLLVRVDRLRSGDAVQRQTQHPGPRADHGVNPATARSFATETIDERA